MEEANNENTPQTTEPPVVLLDANQMKPQCCLETPLGTLILTGTTISNNDLSGHCHCAAKIIPLVSSLSVLCDRLDGSFLSFPVFGINSISINMNKQTERGQIAPLQDLMQTLRKIRYFRQRLEYIIKIEIGKQNRLSNTNILRRCTAGCNDTPDSLKEFQYLCKMVFHEVVVAVVQRQKTGLDPFKGYAKIMAETLADLQREYPDQPSLTEKQSGDVGRLTLQYQDTRRRRHKLDLYVTILDGIEGGFAVYQCEASMPLAALATFPAQAHNPLDGQEEKPCDQDAKQGKACFRDKISSPLDELFDDLPEPNPTSTSVPLLVPTPTVPACFRYFVNQAKRLQTFWDEVDLLDEICGTLEPQTKTIGSSAQYIRTSRTVRLAKNHDDEVCLQIELEPFRPRELPSSIIFYACGGGGQSKLAASFRSQFEKSVRKGLWNNDSSVLENLGRCLEISIIFPVQKFKQHDDRELALPLPGVALEEKLKETLEKEGDVENSTACGICYTLELEEDDEEESAANQSTELPSICCEQKSCGRRYHRSCLREWLDSLPTARIAFGVLWASVHIVVEM